MRKTFYFSFLAAGLLFASCNKNNEATDPDYCGGNWAAEVQTELDAVVNAAIAHGDNPNTQTCNAYKAAYSSYINALEPFGNCTGWTTQLRTQWQETLNEAKAQLNTLCDE